MTKKYTREQLSKLYTKLSEELKEAISSDSTAEAIEEICKKNEITDERVSTIADLVGKVLLGVLPLGDFQETLEKELKLKKGVAKKVSQEINRFIFYPVKSSLEELYKLEVAPPTELKVAKPAKATPAVKEKPSAPPRKDTYREPIE